MSLSTYFFILLAAWATQALPPNDSPLIFSAEPYGATASLNDSAWFGSATAYKAFYIARDSACSKQQVDISVSTDLPYDKRKTNRVVTGCVGECDPTQQLYFHNVPLAIGTYSLSTLGLCIGLPQTRFAAEYCWISGGDMIVRSYRSLPTSPGWVQVTKYDKSQNILEGIFGMDLIDYEQRIARFRKGTFRVKLTQ